MYTMGPKNCRRLYREGGVRTADGEKPTPGGSTSGGFAPLRRWFGFFSAASSPYFKHTRCLEYDGMACLGSLVGSGDPGVKGVFSVPFPRGA